LKAENIQLKKNNKILARKVIEFKAKIDEYENFEGVNLEIRELYRNPEEILQSDTDIKLLIKEAEERMLKSEMDKIGIVCENQDEEDEDEDEEDEEDEEDDEDEDDEDEDEEGNGDELDDGAGEEGEVKRDEIDNNFSIGSHEPDCFSDDEDLHTPQWNNSTILLQHDESGEISDDEKGVEIYTFENINYYVSNKKDGKIYENIDGKVGKVVGRLENGCPFFS
jgi:hypothetical protein